MKIKSIFSKINRNISIVLFLSLIGIYQRVKMLNGRALWNDEIYQVDMIKGAFKPFWTHQIYGDHTHFPGEYLLTYPFVQLFAENKWGLAVPHIPFMLLLFYFTYKISTLYFRSVVGYAVTFLMVSFNIDLVFHALEFRPYAVLPTIALASFYFAHIIVYRYSELSNLKKWLLALFFALAINYHAYGILIGVLPIIFHILQKEKWGLQRTLQSDYIAYVIRFMFFSTLIWGWYALGSSFGMSPNSVQAVRETFQFTVDPRVELMEFLGRVLGNLVGFEKLNRTIFLCSIIPIFCLFNQKRLQQLLFFLILIVIPIVLIVGVDIKTQYWLFKRQYLWVMPYFALLVGWICDQGFVTLKNYAYSLITKRKSQTNENT